MKKADETIAVTVDNLRRVFQVINEHSKKVEHETGLTGPQLWAIKVISEAGEIRVGDLAKRMYLHAATVIGILDRLEARSMIKRTRSVEDRRVVYVELSDKGKKLVKNAPEVAQGLLIKGLEKMPPKMVQDVAAGLQRIVEILGAQKIPPKLIMSTEINAPQKKRAAQKSP